MPGVAGYQDVETIIVLGDETAVDKFRSSHLGTAVDIDMIAGKNSTVVQKDEQLHALSTCVPYSIAGGACLDFSFKGGLHLTSCIRQRTAKDFACLHGS